MTKTRVNSRWQTWNTSFLSVKPWTSIVFVSLYHCGYLHCVSGSGLYIALNSGLFIEQEIFLYEPTTFALKSEVKSL